MVVTDTDEKQLKHGEDADSDSEDSKNSESDVDSEDGEESEEEDRDKDVDPGFRQQLMEVLQAGNALVSRTQGRGGLSTHLRVS